MKRKTPTRPTKKAAPRRNGKTARRQVRRAASPPLPSIHEVRRLLHELQVHSEEITVQNEQLIGAQLELERARDRFADLYDFAPIGYCLLDQRGTVREVNLAAASMLGKLRGHLIGVPLAALIEPRNRESLHAFIQATADESASRLPTVELTVRDGPIIELIARRRAIEQGVPSIFVAMLDVTSQRQLEDERRRILEAEQARSKNLVAENRLRMEAEDRIKALLQRLVTVQEEERRRIALNLHDHLGQQLTALRFNLSVLRESRRSSRDFSTALSAVEVIVDQLDRDIDTLAWDLRPAALDGEGLPGALRNLIEQWSSLTGIAAEVQIAHFESVRLPRDCESQLYRIIQEALNNIAKHAKAKAVSVMLDRRGRDTLLIVEDDGRGFDVAAAARAERNHAGMGLAGIRERAALIGGEAQFESAPGKGTAVFVRIPDSAISLIS